MRSLEKRVKDLEQRAAPRYPRCIRIIEDGGVQRTLDGRPVPDLSYYDLVIVHVIVDPPAYPDDWLGDPA